MPVLDAVERLLVNEAQPEPFPPYNVTGQRAVVFSTSGLPQTVMPVRERIFVPMTPFRYNYELRAAVVQCILERAQHVMQGLCPAVYRGTDPAAIRGYAADVLATESIPIGAVLLNPAHLDFVDSENYPCFVHTDAPIGAIIYLPEPEFLGTLVHSPGTQLSAGILIHGMPITVLTEEGDVGFLPDQENRIGGSWAEFLEHKAPPEPEPESKDVWERLGEDEIL